MTSVEVCIIFTLPVTRLTTRGAPGNLYVPRTIKEFVATFMELHTFSVELLLNKEGFALHLFDAILELRRSPTKHGRESSEEVHPFIL